MAENENDAAITPSFPNGRIKKIMKMDKDINKINAEAVHLVSCSTELFLQFLAERSAVVAIEKKRKIVKLEHLRIAVKRHPATSDFLLDSLPVYQSEAVDGGSVKESRVRPETMVKPLPAGTRRIDQIFAKSGKEAADVSTSKEIRGLENVETTEAVSSVWRGVPVFGLEEDYNLFDDTRCLGNFFFS